MVAVQRFHNCCTPKPQLRSGIFLKKMPPCRKFAREHELWNRSIDNEITSYQTQGSSIEPREVSIMRLSRRVTLA
jgi:hypothetical protein